MSEPLLSRAFPRGKRQSAVQADEADPLAELARIVGEDDPFRDILGEAHRAARSAEHRPYEAGAFDNPDLGQGYQTAPDAYETVDFNILGTESGYAELQDQGEYYDEESELGPDISLKKPRVGLIAAGVVTLAVLGGAGYAYFNGDSNTVTAGNPPVIHADPGPTKTVPEKTAEAPQHSKLIYDRVGAADKPGDEKVVSRTEEPVDLPVPPADAADPAVPAMPALPADAASSTPPPSGGAPDAAPASPGEPRRVRTVLIRPDGTAGEPDMTLPQAPSAALSGPAPQAAAQPSGYPFSIIENDDLARPGGPVDPSISAGPPPVAPPPPARPAVPPTSSVQRSAAASAAPPARPAPAAPAAPRPAAAAPAAQRPAAPPAATAQQRVASLPNPASAATSSPRVPAGTFTVQLTSQRSEQDARAAFAGLQRKYPNVLGSRQPSIQKADLGSRGTYYRVKIVAGTRDAAAQLCSSLKAAGGDCVVGN